MFPIEFAQKKPFGLKKLSWQVALAVTLLATSLSSPFSPQAAESCDISEQDLMSQCAAGETKAWSTSCWNQALTLVNTLPITEALNSCRGKFGMAARNQAEEEARKKAEAEAANRPRLVGMAAPVAGMPAPVAPPVSMSVRPMSSIVASNKSATAIAVGKGNTAANSAGAIRAQAMRESSEKVILPSRAVVFDASMPTPNLRENTERYGEIKSNPVVRTAEQPVSTFSIDVDTGSYTNVRRMLNRGNLPPSDAVRVEEMLNYFPYTDAAPTEGKTPFAVHSELAPSPWKKGNVLLRVALKGQALAPEAMPPANLVFLIDISGSMSSEERLPLVKSSLKLLVDKLRPQDKVAIVTYANGTRVALTPTSGSQKAEIKAVIDSLSASGGTYGAGGIQLAYAMAEQNLLPGGINRILLATDGDFNVGITRFESLKDMVQAKHKTGVALTTLGFGVGNYNEHLMEQLADAGNGQYAYIDTLSEGQKVLSEEMTASLAVVAADVKAQIEFNPAVIREYRQIGYENRALQREDFTNDKVDAGEMGYGHGVTMLYELTPVSEKGLIEPLRYGKTEGKPDSHAKADNKANELGFLRLRYKKPGEDNSQEMSFPLAWPGKDKVAKQVASDDFRFSAAVAAFGQWLRQSPYLGNFGAEQIIALADGAKGKDEGGYRSEFVKLAKLAQALSQPTPAAGTSNKQ